MKSDKEIHNDILEDVKNEVNEENHHIKHHDNIHNIAHDKNNNVRHDRNSPRHHDNNEHHEHYNHLSDEDGSGVRKRIIVLFGAVFMIFLMLSFAFVTYPISDIILSESVASDASTSILEFGDGYKVIFEEKVFNNLLKHYREESEIEFVVCMKGFFDDKTYFIDSFYEPDIYSRTFNHVSFKSCDSESLVLLHSHPHKHCVASNQDIETQNKMKETEPNALMMVMCEFDRISVYR